MKMEGAMKDNGRMGKWMEKARLKQKYLRGKENGMKVKELNG